MRKNDYLRRKEIERQIWVQTSERITQQFMTDTLQITLHQEFGFGYDRIMALTEKWEDTMREYKAALNSKNVEADLAQEHMDRVLKQIIRGKAELIPFKERYPEIREVKYG